MPCAVHHKHVKIINGPAEPTELPPNSSLPGVSVDCCGCCRVRGAATVRCVLSLASKLEEHIADIIESYSALLNPVPFVDTEWPVSSNQAVAACSSSSSRRGPACAPCGGSSFNYTSKHGLRQLQDACCAFLEVCQPLKGQLAAYEGLAVHLEAQQTAATAEAAAAVADAEQRAVELPKKSTSLFRHQFCFFLLVAVILNAGTGMAVYYVCKSHQGKLFWLAQSLACTSLQLAKSLILAVLPARTEGRAAQECGLRLTGPQVGNNTAGYHQM